MKNLFSFLSALLIFFLFTTVNAKDIWRVESPADPYEDLPIANKGILHYHVPSVWESLPGYIDSNFPSFLFASANDEDKPQEIRIDFSYLQSYNNPNLTIRAETPLKIDPNNPYYLMIFKELFKGEVFYKKRMTERGGFHAYEFPLGYIQKGLSHKNRIVIRTIGPPNTFITFDSFRLYLDDTDSDGDGVSDVDEGDASQDRGTVSIPIRSYDPDPLIRHKVTLHMEESIPYFQGVRFLDSNDLQPPDLLMHDKFLLLDILEFKIKEMESLEYVHINIGYTDTLYPSLRLYAHQGPNIWQELPHEIIDSNTTRIILNDGGAGDFDKEKNDTIHLILALAYPKEFDTTFEKNGCFIKSIFRREENEADF